MIGESRDKTARSLSELTYQKLRSQIANGDFVGGDRLPGEPQLAEQMGVSRVTLRRALDRLMAEGLVERRPGAGTYIREREFNGPVVVDLASLLAHAAEFTDGLQVELRNATTIVPSQSLQATMRLGPSERVEMLYRVVSRQGEPVGVQRIYIPTRIMMNPVESFDPTLCIARQLANQGLVIDRAHQRYTADAATNEIAQDLRVAPGHSLIWVTRALYDSFGRSVLLHQSAYRGDRISFQFDALRAGFSLRRSEA